ncbi:hypothetical protein F4825DRAFT_225147 [Nemania diffusa]|nr:hypothetical protein F4825DRAFT_225147 [Nemania diffusa]
MDDPWGSPWASTDAPSDNDPPPPSRANIFLSPPPKAFFGNGAGLSAQSPWSDHDDDGGGFGVRRSGDRADGTDSQNEWSNWADSGIQPPRLSPRLSNSSKETLAWPGNAAASPVLIANPRSRTPSILRHHSPDPWATEFSLTNRSEIELPNLLRVTSSNAPTIETGQVAEASQSSQSASKTRLEDKNTEEPPVEKEYALEGVIPTRENGHPGTHRPLADGDANTISKLDPAVYEIPSRPSSACTIDSHDGQERQDSPITSIDEDRGTRMQNKVRKTSGKVQELVGKFDGLARAASEEPPVSGQRGTSRSASHEKLSERKEIEDDESDNDDDEAGFGDFEDALANAGRVTESSDQASPSEFSTTPKVELKDGFPWRSSDEREEGHITSIEAVPIQSQDMSNKFRHINFDMNLASVDKLFPKLPDSLASDSAEDCEIPDHPIRDSFTTISERKAWYRMSRYGSLHRHNSGDDENYRRVTWSTSQLHSDTIKIVRRWMEQDSYAGKATLGGTKRTGFFDWDSDAAPVRLDEVFQRKIPVTTHTRTTSIPASNAFIQNVSTVERPYRNSTGISLSAELQSASQAIMPVPSFGWNSEAKNDPPPAISSGTSQKQKPHLESVQTTSIEEDDDDWGEMISSPRVAQGHTEPSIFAPPIPTSPTENRRPASPFSPSTFTVNQYAGVKLPEAQATQLTPSNPLLFPDISVLDKITQPPNRPTQYISQIEGFTDLKTNTPPANQDSLQAPSKRSVIRGEAPIGSMAASQAAVNKASPTNIPVEGIAGAPTSANWPKSESQDDIIVQNILQSLPDLSYMLR